MLFYCHYDTIIVTIYITHIIIFDKDIAVLNICSCCFGNSCSRWWRSAQCWWRPSAFSLTNSSYTTSPRRAISITSSLSLSYASACHGTAPSGFYSKDCTWHGRIRSRTKNSWFLQALHACRTAGGWGFLAWNFWCTSHRVENKCNRHYQKSQWSLCLPDTRYGVPGGGQEALEHNYKCTLQYEAYMLYLGKFRVDFIYLGQFRIGKIYLGKFRSEITKYAWKATIVFRDLLRSCQTNRIKF